MRDRLSRRRVTMRAMQTSRINRSVPKAGDGQAFRRRAGAVLKSGRAQVSKDRIRRYLELSVAASALSSLFIPVYYLQGVPWGEAILAGTSFALPCVALGALLWRAQARRWLNLPGVSCWSLHVL